MDGWIDLKPDRLLLDSEFEGYRLSLDKLPSYTQDLPSELLVLKQPLRQYSLQHVKTFTSHNHLIEERWSDSLFYFISQDLAVYSVHDSLEVRALSEPVNVFSGGSTSGEVDKCEDGNDLYNPTLTFPSNDLAILSDGKGRIILLETGDRTLQKFWKVLYSINKEQGVHLYDSMLLSGDGGEKSRLTLLAAHVEENGEKKYCTVISHITFSLNNNADWREGTTLQYKTFDVENAYLDSKGQVYIASRLHDFSLPGETNDEEKASGDGETEECRYSWLQADDDIVLTLALPPDVTKSDLEVDLTGVAVDIRVRGTQLLAGQLFKAINRKASTWTFSGGNDKRLEVYLSKSQSVWWTEFVVGDKQGKMITDPELAESINEGLEYLTTETMAKDQQGTSLQEMEACDMVEQEATFLCVLSPPSRKPVHVVNFAGSNWLYNKMARGPDPASFCTRHDVDGVMWTPNTCSKDLYTHSATFNALNYIQASKESRKFISSPDDSSYVAIADVEKRVYVYRQPKPVDSDVRNRKTGKSLSHVSAQQVISLEDSQSIHGFCTTNTAIYVLTSCQLHKFLVA